MEEQSENSEDKDKTIEDDSNDDEQCIVTGLTKRQKQVLLNSWAKLKGNSEEDADNLGLELVLWMLEEIPHMRKLFRKFNAKKNNAELSKDQMFVAHTKKVIGSLDTAMGVLTNSDEFALVATSVCALHVNLKPSVGSKYFDPFHEKFHLFIEKRLSLPPDHEEVQLWTDFLGVVCAVIKSEEAKLPKKSGCCVVM
ncbi:globin-like [Physella acuta]|uniref:globin-like n=1 Tax=Physella acuta TaxID=109671 RepID=UPI0027DDF46C|nr:globin-like [Physella acuta]